MTVSYNRTSYQGDPFMTRHGETRTVSDYEHRYGSFTAGYPSSGDASLLSDPIQQYLEDGTLAIETPNLRSFEVLAALDFYTTMGTGSLGGTLFPGTFTDVGCIVNNPESATRIPGGIETTDTLAVRTRAFTEGQKTSKNRAKAQVEFTPFLRVHSQPPNLDNRWDAEHPTTQDAATSEWWQSESEIPWPVNWIDKTKFILTTLDGTKVTLYAREAGLIEDLDEFGTAIVWEDLTYFPIGKEHFHTDIFSQTESLRGDGFHNVGIDENGLYISNSDDGIASNDPDDTNLYRGRHTLVLDEHDWEKYDPDDDSTLGDPDTAMIQTIDLSDLAWPHHFERGDVVSINAPNMTTGLVLDAWVSASNVITCRVKNTKNRDSADRYDLVQQVEHNFGEWDGGGETWDVTDTNWPTDALNGSKALIATFSNDGEWEDGVGGTRYDFDRVEEGDTVVVNWTDDVLGVGDVDGGNDADWEHYLMIDGWVPEGGGAVTIRVKQTHEGRLADAEGDLIDFLPVLQIHVRVIKQRTEAMVQTVPADQEVFIRVSGERYSAKKTAYNFARCVNKHPSLQRMVIAESLDTTVTLASVSVGEEGNDNHIAIDWVTESMGPDLIDHTNPTYSFVDSFEDWWNGQLIKFKPIRLIVPHNNLIVGEYVTATHFAGGIDLALNAGDGTTRLALTGMTERFPLGILCQDSDFLGENPLGDNATAVKTSPAGIRSH